MLVTGKYNERRAYNQILLTIPSKLDMEDSSTLLPKVTLQDYLKADEVR